MSLELSNGNASVLLSADLPKGYDIFLYYNSFSVKLQ